MLKPASATALLVALFLAGCSSAPSTTPDTALLAASSFENMDGWLADSPALATLNQDQAHTGKYSTMVSPGHEFSLGYSNKLSKLAPDWPAQLKVGAWVMLPNDQAAAKLVVEVQAPEHKGPNLLWEGFDLTQSVKRYNQWQYVEYTITLPTAAGPNHRLLAYLWLADSKQPVYLDDLKIFLPGK
ncbi:hypothetical protein [Hymenobacter sp. BT730]|uniref:hypothetical protein n=1 Tax=Hymenobacter sp. BT730 TaxID=3063332 RepID=UPI0026DF512D|nr:hypothetical protein [Hymenobacter sp. BT730]